MSVTPIHQAAKEGHVAWLRKASKKEINKGDGDGWTAMHWCAWNGNLEPLQIVIDRGGDVDRADDNGSTSLHIAATYGNINALELLISNCANLFSLDNHGRTAARVAAYYKKAECCRYLDMLAIRWQVQSSDGVRKLQIKAMKELKRRSKKLAEDDSKPRGFSYDYATASSSGTSLDSHKERPVSASSSQQEGKKKLSQQDALRQNFELRSSGSLTSMDKSEGNNSAGSTFRNLPRNRAGPILNSLAQLPLKIERPDDGRRRHSVLEPLHSPEDSRNSKDLPQLEITGGHPTITLNESALATFLHSLDLVDCVQKLHSEKLDLDALSLCSEEDLISIGLSLGPRKKILNAIARRKAFLAGSGKLTDSEF